MAKERFFNLPVLILIASSFMLGMSEFIVVGILPDIAADLKISEVTVGNLVSLFAFVYAPVTPLGSALSARFPRFATHLTLIGIFLAGNLLCAFAPNYAVLVVARIMIALVSGTLVAVAMTYVPDVTTDRFRTKFIAWVFSGFSIASVVGVPVGTWVANTFGWRWAFHMINVLTIMLIVGMVVALPRNSHIVKIGFLPQFRLFFDRRIQLGVLTVVFGAAASYVFYTYLTPIMRDEVHVPEQYLSVGLVIFGAACLWSNLYGGKLAVKVGIDQFLNWLDSIERAMLKAESDAGFYAPGPFKELVEKGKTPRDWRKSLYYHYYEFPGFHSVRAHYGVKMERYKLMHFYVDDNWELYDLKTDPEEMHNLYGKKGMEKITTELKAELARLQKEYDVPQELCR